MNPGNIVVVRRYPGPRGRAGELAPSESYARVVGSKGIAIVVDVCGIRFCVSPENYRLAPKAVHP